MEIDVSPNFTMLQGRKACGVGRLIFCSSFHYNSVLHYGGYRMSDNSSEKKDFSSLIISIVAILLQGAAWILPSVSQAVRISALIFSVVIVLFSQPGSYQGFRARLVPLIALLSAKWPLLLAAILSGSVILSLPGSFDPNIAVGTQLIMMGLLAASVVGLVLGRRDQPSIRVVQGSSDRAYLIEDGIKRFIPDPLTHDFVMHDKYRQTERISDLELGLYRTGNPLPKISACRLVKGSGPPQYVIWEGRRKQLPDGPTKEYFFSDKEPDELTDIELEEIPRTGSLRTILAGIGSQGNIIINGEVTWVIGRQEK